MKKLALIAMVVVTASLFGTEVKAQVKNRVGFFLAAASGDVDMIGLGGVGEFRVMDKLTISPQLIFYFPEERGNNVDVHFFEFNVNANYYFYNHDILEFYGLGGLNYSRVKVDYDGPGGGDASDGELGLNLGAGLNFEIGQKFIPFTELRLTIGEFDQFVFNAGLKFNLN